MVSGSTPRRIKPLRKHTQLRAIEGLARPHGGVFVCRTGPSLVPRVLRRLHYQSRSDLSVAEATYVVVLPTISGQSHLVLPENHRFLALERERS